MAVGLRQGQEEKSMDVVARELGVTINGVGKERSKKRENIIIAAF